MKQGPEQNQNIIPSNDYQSEGVLTATPSDLQEYFVFFSRMIRESRDVYSEEDAHSASLNRSPDIFQKKIEDGSVKVLTFKDNSGQLIGTLEAREITNSTNGEKFGNIVWIFVEPTYRGKKLDQINTTIAKYLNARADEFFQETGCVGMIASIRDNNVRSIGMHESIGFKKDNMWPADTGRAWYTKRL